MSAQYGPNIPTNGLVLNLDAGNKRSYPGTGNNWYDLSNQKNHCTLQTGTAAFSNGGIYFDMSTFWRGSDKGFNYGINPSTQIVWSRPATVSANKIMFYYGTSNTSQSRGMEVLGTSNYRFWGYGNDQDSGLSMTLNTWNMAVAVYQGSTTPYQRTYLNDRTGNTGSLSWNTTSTGYYYVGADTGYVVGTRAWYGNIGQILVYNRVLSPSEILQVYNAQKVRFGL